MATLIKYPHTDQFKQIIKHIKSNADYHQVPTPIVEFEGTVKLHGSNFSVLENSDGEIWFQSRERIITPVDDNAGSAMWAAGKIELFKKVFKDFREKIDCGSNTIQIYGEWCGGNIQKGVGICNLPKMFVVFAIRLSEDAESHDWLNSTGVRELLNPHVNYNDKFMHIYQFPTYRITVDPLKPEIAQNKLVELTMQVEEQCPVAATLLPIPYPACMVGEGIVWTCVSTHPIIPLRGLRFKTKGSAHSSSKVKTIVAIDEEKVNSVNQFVETTVTINRLEQGLTKLQEMGLDPSDPKNTGEYLRWITTDVLREENDLLIASQLDVKAVKGKIAVVARQYFLNQN